MRLGVKRKLIGGFIVVNVVFIGLSAFQLVQADRLRERAVANNEQSLKASDLAATLESSYLKISMTYSQAPGGDPLKVPELAKLIESESKILNDAIATFPTVATGPELEQFDKVVVSYKGLTDASASMASAKTQQQVADASTATTKFHNEFLANLAALRVINSEEAHAANNALDENFQSTLRITLGILLLLAVACLAGGWNIANRVANLFFNGARELGDSAQSLDGTSRRVRESAAQTVQRADDVNNTSQHVSQSVNTVTVAVEQMQASIEEIARSTGEATRVAESALQTVATTNARVQTLGESSAEIGKVIEVITSIAEQTNLLALNATIEAARAGDAGKGFAVVANEVKELAKQTAQATEEISARIVAIQSDSIGAVEAISEISTVMSQISDIQSTIASAIEEQSATTAEIGNNIVQAAGGVNDIAGSIGAVANAARETLTEVRSTDEAADSMHRLASNFRAAVEGGEVQDRITEGSTVGERVPQSRRFLADAPAFHEPSAENRLHRTHV